MKVRSGAVELQGARRRRDARVRRDRPRRAYDCCSTLRAGKLRAGRRRRRWLRASTCDPPSRSTRQRARVARAARAGRRRAAWTVWDSAAVERPPRPGAPGAARRAGQAVRVRSNAHGQLPRREQRDLHRTDRLPAQLKVRGRTRGLFTSTRTTPSTNDYAGRSFPDPRRTVGAASSSRRTRIRSAATTKGTCAVATPTLP